MAPIFAHLGEESSLNDDLGSIGILSDNVARFGALQVYIEHRLFGESIPEALKDANLRGYCSSAQALPDYAEVLLHIKKKYPAGSTPVMVFGGSYGGLRKPLDAAEELKNFLDSFFSVAAHYDRPPRYPVDPVCKGIDSAPEGSDVLDKIFSGIVAYFREKPCYNLDAFFSAETLDGWTWLASSRPFDLKEYIEECKSKFGVPP